MVVENRLALLIRPNCLHREILTSRNDTEGKQAIGSPMTQILQSDFCALSSDTNPGSALCRMRPHHLVLLCMFRLALVAVNERMNQSLVDMQSVQIVEQIKLNIPQLSRSLSRPTARLRCSEIHNRAILIYHSSRELESLL